MDEATKLPIGPEEVLSLIHILGCCAMGVASAWLPFLVIFVIAKVGFSGSLVFYDSMLSDVTTPERMDEVSSRGYAWGYIGSCVPFVVCLGLVLGAGSIGISQICLLYTSPAGRAGASAGVPSPAGQRRNGRCH